MNSNKATNDETSVILTRFKALFFDWLFICLYLLILLSISLALYFLVLDGIPEFTNIQSQLIATLTSVLPIIVIFSMMEGSEPFASWGKRKSNLKVLYNNQPLKRSIVRNTIKFLPWQLGHMSTINGMYHDFNTLYSMVFFVLSMALPISYILMVFLRKDSRHLADLLTKSKVVKVERSI
ncbi:RDD family protein [Pelagirhabdus alkalitolerans]|uniref:RDD family protein n=1 Tax=Pelagirhabdus alkalitolerans TaxID=1612202 RepID=A0A1G6GSB5_9BACI|nr:RDD family protein [Pelagirhabdus alkalitolerans]SDB84066.1 RDD family protein [Pelagirhabdus alkalitolerans]